MLQIKVKGQSVQEIVQQMTDFVKAFESSPLNYSHTSEKPTVPSKTETVAAPVASVKRSVGRPSKTKLQALQEPQTTNEKGPTPNEEDPFSQDLVRATGIEPTPQPSKKSMTDKEIGATGSKPVAAIDDSDPFSMTEATPPSAPEPTSAPKKLTKEQLAQILQKVCEKEDGGAGEQSIAGLNKVRNILSKFGIKRLGELDEKRYHELYKAAEQELNF